MATQIEIQSINYNGQIADITFYPCSGGSVSLGSHTIPYIYTNDEYQGTYDLYFSAYSQTCQLNIPCATTTPTPTPTNTPTITPTNTPTQTVTPTNTLTPTPTPTELWYTYTGYTGTTECEVITGGTLVTVYSLTYPQPYLSLGQIIYSSPNISSPVPEFTYISAGTIPLPYRVVQVNTVGGTFPQGYIGYSNPNTDVDCFGIATEGNDEIRTESNADITTEFTEN